MTHDEKAERGTSKLGDFADRLFHQIELIAYILLGLLLAAGAALGMGDTTVLLLRSVQARGDSNLLVITIDHLLFVLMVVEILHTVRVSFRSGTLVAEPFLVVGLIASIRRVLVITLESSQATEIGKSGADVQAHIHSTLLELIVLGGLILVMVMSIYLLRRTKPGL